MGDGLPDDRVPEAGSSDDAAVEVGVGDAVSGGAVGSSDGAAFAGSAGSSLGSGVFAAAVPTRITRFTIVYVLLCRNLFSTSTPFS